MYFTDKIFYVGHNMNMHMLNQFLKLPSMAWQCFYQLMLLCFLLLQLMEMQALSHGNRLHRDWKTLNVTTATVRGLSVLVTSQLMLYMLMAGFLSSTNLSLLLLNQLALWS